MRKKIAVLTRETEPFAPIIEALGRSFDSALVVDGPQVLAHAMEDIDLMVINVNDAVRDDEQWSRLTRSGRFVPMLFVAPPDEQGRPVPFDPCIQLPCSAEKIVARAHELIALSEAQ